MRISENLLYDKKSQKKEGWFDSKKQYSKALAALVLMFAMLAGCLQRDAKMCYAQETEIKASELFAMSACLMDAATGRVLYAKNAQQQMPMASTTKIMTCILALELGQADALVTVSERAARQPKVHMGASVGEQFLLKDLLYSLMLESHNDAAVMIAEQVSGSVEAFAQEMNRKAREIGCEQSYFITPNGLDAEDEQGVHSTTAADLARIMRYCIRESSKKDLFLEITRTPAYTFWNHEKTKVYQATNHNAFLNMMEGALSGKTGYTNDAGYCYVGALQSGGETYIVSLLACGWPNNKNYKWQDTKKLMQYGLEHYDWQDVFEEKEFPRVHVKNGQGQRIGEIATTSLGFAEKREDLTVPLLMRQDESVEIIYDLPSQLAAPVAQGQKVGSVSYYMDGILLKTYPVYVMESVPEIDFSWCLEKILGIYQM